MNESERLLESARAAMARHDWQDSLRSFVGLDAVEPLSPAELETMSDVAFWAGQSTTAADARQRAFATYLEGGRLEEAAAAAVMLSRLHFARGDMAVAWGWLGRAQRLLAALPECAAHADLAWTEANLMQLTGDHDQALARARDVEVIGTRVGDRDRELLGIAAQGYFRVKSGDASAGMRLLDEALAAAMAGELKPFTTAEVFCEMVVSCIEVTDYERATQWLEMAERLGQAFVCFPGCCRVHRATVLRHRGEWDHAQREALLARRELAGNEILHEGMALCEIGELYRRKNEIALAEAAFKEAYEKGFSPPSGLALILLVHGDVAGASRMVESAIDRYSDEPGTLLFLLQAQVEIAIAAGDLLVAKAAASRLTDIASRLGTTAAAAAGAGADGLVLQQQGELAAAAKRLEASVRCWHEARNPYEAARARVRHASVLEAMGDTSSARLDLETARRTFERLGAEPEASDVARRLGDDVARRTESTFMFTDIVDSTSLLATIGDEQWHNIRRWHDKTLGSLIADHRGRVVKQTGDGVFASFEDSRLALDCAISIQRTLDNHRRTHGFAPSVRIGLHTGEATIVGDDYAGRDVVIAARIAALANAEEIFVSAQLADQAHKTVSVVDRRSVLLKGIQGRTEIATIAWR